MKGLKTILFLIFSIFLCFRTYVMLKNLWVSEPSELDLSKTLLLGFLINLYITGVFAFPGFVLTTHKMLPESYYGIRNKKLLLRMYRFLQVNSFRKFLLIAYWGKRKNRLNYFNGTKSGLQNFIYQSKQSEFGHVAAFTVITLLCIALFYKDYYLLCCFAMVINVIGNLYPVILQRYHRIRIEKILN